MDDHGTHLQEKCKSMKLKHGISDTDSGTMCELPTNTSVSCQTASLNKVVQEKPCYEQIGANNFCSVDPKTKHQYVQDLKKKAFYP